MQLEYIKKIVWTIFNRPMVQDHMIIWGPLRGLPSYYKEWNISLKYIYISKKKLILRISTFETSKIQKFWEDAFGKTINWILADVNKMIKWIRWASEQDE